MMTYAFYMLIVLIITYGNRDKHAYLQKGALETAIVFGGTVCETVPSDDPRFRPCTPESLPKPHVNFLKLVRASDWWNWINDTVLPNVRVQNWYNGRPPYGLRGYLDDRVNRLIGYAIIRQTREKNEPCR